ncbi:DUF1697 domain-containing protein [uncultured Algibacter sp.]|uniref:DUF1697 domain-containing protein n=1 Tax=uncultured Algibacter sp. TaxID=298659 RepID=UPI0032162302
MQTYIALLRGINVSGQKKVPMADLRELLTQIDFKSIQTYIQSGNVVFKSSQTDKNKLEEQIAKRIEEHFGFLVPVLVKTSNDIQEILDDCPYPDEKMQRSYFTLLHTSPNNTLVDVVSKEVYKNESFVISPQCVYFFSELGYGKAKCNNNFFERKLKVSATTRNYKTMLKLLSLSSDSN